jgi:hypothetical protein
MKILSSTGQKVDFPVDPHFIPNYNPWEQRFVLRQTVIFKAIRKEKQLWLPTKLIDSVTELF